MRHEIKYIPIKKNNTQTISHKIKVCIHTNYIMNKKDLHKKISFSKNQKKI